MKRFAVLALLAALAVPAAAQQQPFQEQIEVNAVLLDVIVTDARGNQILGLGPDDFIVKENGVAQKLDSVDYFTNRRLLDSTEANAPFQVERVREDRYFIFFFDKPSDPGPLNGQLVRARQSVLQFIRKDMKDTDLVAIAGHDMRLKVYSDFTSDKKQLERALGDATRFGRGITKADNSEGASILRNIDADKMVKHTGTVYQALDLLADATRSIRARKNLVLFSPGIADREEDVLGGQLLVTRSRYLDPALESLNAANVSVYGVQLQQVQAGPQTLIHQRLGEISQSTGGTYFQFNTTFDNAVNRVEETNAGYYLLSYRAPAGSNGYRKVDVSLRNPEFKVISRSGYSVGS
jgi:VWFA-related protein